MKYMGKEFSLGFLLKEDILKVIKPASLTSYPCRGIFDY